MDVKQEKENTTNAPPLPRRLGKRGGKWTALQPDYRIAKTGVGMRRAASTGGYSGYDEHMSALGTTMMGGMAGFDQGAGKGK